MKIPATLKQLIDRHHDGRANAVTCAGCSGSCCRCAGFAVLENVLAIYDLYLSGALEREGHVFPPQMSLREFIFAYFDVWSRTVGPEDDERDLVFFHVKSIDEKGRPISIPGEGEYWRTREALFEQNPWLNYGCAFLDRPLADEFLGEEDLSVHSCILHSADSHEVVGPKPIDCLYFACDGDRQGGEPTPEECDEWYYALARAFPGSVDRYEDLIGE